MVYKKKWWALKSKELKHFFEQISFPSWGCGCNSVPRLCVYKSSTLPMSYVHWADGFHFCILFPPLQMCLAPVRGSVWIRTRQCPCKSSFSSLRRNRWKPTLEGEEAWTIGSEGKSFHALFIGRVALVCEERPWCMRSCFSSVQNIDFYQRNNHKARKCAPCAEWWSCIGPVSIP